MGTKKPRLVSIYVKNLTKNKKETIFEQGNKV